MLILFSIEVDEETILMKFSLKSERSFETKTF